MGAELPIVDALDPRDAARLEHLDNALDMRDSARRRIDGDNPRARIHQAWHRLRRT